MNRLHGFYGGLLKISPPTGIRSPDRSTPWRVDIPTELFRLVVALNEKYGFENMRKENFVRSSRDIATEIEGKETLCGGTISGFVSH
jgi:hypothetical protein